MTYICKYKIILEVQLWYNVRKNIFTIHIIRIVQKITHCINMLYGDIMLVDVECREFLWRRRKHENRGCIMYSNALSFMRTSVQLNFRRDNLWLVFSSLKWLAKLELDFSFNLIIEYPELHWQLMYEMFALF